MEIIGTIVLLVAIVISTRYLVRQNEEAVKLIKDLTKQPSIEPSPRSAPNTITKADENVIAFEEGNPLDLPKNIKFQVEGGDTFVPYGYEEKEETRQVIKE